MLFRSARTEYTYGDMWGPPEMLFTDEDLLAKFAGMTQGLMPERQRAEVARLVLHDLDMLETLEPLVVLVPHDAGYRSGARQSSDRASE